MYCVHCSWLEGTPLAKTRRSRFAELAQTKLMSMMLDSSTVSVTLQTPIQGGLNDHTEVRVICSVRHPGRLVERTSASHPAGACDDSNLSVRALLDQAGQ